MSRSKNPEFSESVPDPNDDEKERGKRLNAVEKLRNDGALAAALEPTFTDLSVRPLRSAWDFTLDEVKFISQDMYLSRRWRLHWLKQVAIDAKNVFRKTKRLHFESNSVLEKYPRQLEHTRKIAAAVQSFWMGAVNWASKG
jgi:hypothetical protein